MNRPRLRLDGAPLGEPFDCHSPKIGTRTVPLGAIRLPEGGAVLRIEAAGKSGRSSGFNAGLDAVLLDRGKG